MDNINFITGTTTDGHDITLDGFRVESFESFTNDSGDDCVRLYFKSGKEISVFAGNDKGDSIMLQKLSDFFYEDIDLPPLKFHHPEAILCNKPNGGEFSFDGLAIEFHVSYENADGDDVVELHFVSGRTVTVLLDLDEDFYPGENVITLVDDCICRYFKDDEDQVTISCLGSIIDKEVEDMKKFDDYFDFIEAVTTAISNNDDVYIFNNADGYYFDEESNKSKDFFTDKMFDMRALQMNLFERYLDGEFPDNEKKLHIVLDYVHDENDAINPIYDRLFIFR